jgi:hypothetical protein
LAAVGDRVTWLRARGLSLPTSHQVQLLLDELDIRSLNRVGNQQPPQLLRPCLSDATRGSQGLAVAQRLARQARDRRRDGPNPVTRRAPRSSAGRTLWYMTADDYFNLIDAGILTSPIELLDGRVMFGGEYELHFSPQQADAAAALGVQVPTCVDLVLADPSLRTDIIDRLARGD